MTDFKQKETFCLKSINAYVNQNQDHLGLFRIGVIYMSREQNMRWNAYDVPYIDHLGPSKITDSDHNRCQTEHLLIHAQLNHLHIVFVGFTRSGSNCDKLFLL